MVHRLTLGLAVLLVSATLSVGAESVRFGLITDTHAHDIDSPLESKWMSNTETRMLAFTAAMNLWAPDFVIELGDFINGWVVLGADPGDPARIPDILQWADELYGAFEGPRYHVIGNHDLYNLDKATYLEILEMEATSFSFDVGGVHFVVLDVQFSEDGEDLAHTYTGVAGYLPASQIEWLRADLAGSTIPAVVFLHQPLDDFIEEWDRPTVLNQTEIREVLAADGDVIAVLQGHTHSNSHHLLDDIHFVTFEALVDQGTPPSWAQITIDTALRTLVIEGIGEQASYELPF